MDVRRKRKLDNEWIETAVTPATPKPRARKKTRCVKNKQSTLTKFPLFSDTPNETVSQEPKAQVEENTLRVHANKRSAVGYRETKDDPASAYLTKEEANPVHAPFVPPRTVAELSVHSVKVKEVRSALEDAVDRLRSPHKFRVPMVLIHGRSGCGKSTVAEVLLRELGVSVWTIDCQDVQENRGDQSFPEALAHAIFTASCGTTFS